MFLSRPLAAVALAVAVATFVSPVASTPAPYVATSIEHVAVSPSGPVTSAEEAAAVLHANIDLLAPQIATAALSEKSDLVVLSEMALTSLNFNRSQMAKFLITLPLPGNTSLCPSAGTPERVIRRSVPGALERLACLAATNNVYLVANWGDRMPCADYSAAVPCPSDGYFQFNTELVFDPTGAFIQRYWKMHTFNATEFDTPAYYDAAFFEFIPPRSTYVRPIRIGLAVCFDSMYADPILPLLHGYGISDFVISHWWVNQYASMGATPWFTAVSRAFGINLVYAATVWTKVYPWGSGSGIIARGEVQWAAYRTEHENVKIGSDIIMTAVLTSVAVPPLAAVLPRYTTPPSSTQKPLPMWIATASVTAEQLAAAAVENTPVTLEVKETKGGSFWCSVKALPQAPANTTAQPGLGSSVGTAQPLPAAQARWVLMGARGYYHEADGTKTYYHEEFCSFFQCNEPTGDCSGNWQSIDDDHGGRAFAAVALEASFRGESLVFPMVIDGTGNTALGRPADQGFRSSLGFSANGTDVVGQLRGSANVTLSTLATTTPAAPLLATTMLARQYQLDYKQAQP